LPARDATVAVVGEDGARLIEITGTSSLPRSARR
jgi:hypothetical protein